MTSVGVRQHTQDVCDCPWLSGSTHRTSVGVRQHTQDVCGCPTFVAGLVCPCVSVSTHRTSVAVHQYTYQHAGPWTQHAGPSRGLFGTSMCVRQHTQDVCGCPWLSIRRHLTSVAVRVCPCVSVSTHRTSVAVRVCPYVSVSTQRTSVAFHQYTYQHVGPWTQHAALPVDCVGDFGPRRSWLSISTHISTLILGLSMLALPVDCSGDFSPRGLSVQYTNNVCGCPSAHTGRPCVSFSTHRTSVAVRVCPSAHTGRPWLSISTHIRTLVLGLSTLTLPVDCLDTERLWLSVCVRQHTHDVCGCPPAHTGHLWLSVCFCVCPSAHTRRLWLSISTHISTLVLGLSTLTLPVDCLGDFGLSGLSVQYTQNVRWCPPAHTGRLWLSVAVHQKTQDVRGCPCVSVSTHMMSVGVRQHTQDVCGCPCVSVCVHQHTQDVCGCPSVHISARCTHRTSVGVRQHTQDVCGCPWLSIRRHRTSVAVRVCLCVSVSTHRTSVAVRVCPYVSVSTQRTSAAFHQYTYQHVVHTGRLWVSASTQRTFVAVRECPSAHTGRSWLSISTHISKLILGLSMLALPVDGSGDFSPRGLSVQYINNVCGCPSAHTGRPWLYVAVHQQTQDVCGCQCVSVSTHMTSVGVRQHTQDVRGCPWLSDSTHRTSVGVRPHTQDLCGTFVAGLVCPCVSVSTHRTSVAVHQYTYQHARPWTQHAGPSRGLFGTSMCVRQHTQDVCGCPWLSIKRHMTSVAVRVCPCVSVSTHRTSVADRVCPYVSVSTQRTSVAFHQYTYQHAVCLVHTGRLWVSASTQRTFVAVRECPSAHTGRSWLSISTHISKLILGLSMLALPVDCSGDFSPRGLSVQYTNNVCGCPSAHTGRPWLSVAVHQQTQDVCGCPCVSVSTHMTSVGVRQHTQDVRGCLWLSDSTHRTSVGVRQHTQDLCGCPSAHTGRPCVFVSTHRTFVAGLVCPCVSVSTHRTSVVVHQYTYQHAGPWTQHAGPSRGLFGTSMCVRQHTQDVCGCPWLSIRRHRTSVAVRVCPCVSVSTHRTSVADRVCPYVSVSTQRTSVSFHQYTYQHAVCLVHTGRLWVSANTQRTFVAVRVCPSAHTGRSWLSISTHISTLILGLSMLALPVDCSGDFSPRGLSVQYTNNVCGCPSAHTGRPCVSISTHRTSVAVRVCPSAHTGRPWLSISTHIRMLVLGLSTLTLPVDCLDTGHLWLSVCVRQHTHDVCGCPPAHTGRLWLSVCFCVCPSAHTGRLWLSISTHISTLVLGLSTLTLPVDCLGDFGLSGLSVQYTQNVRWCPPAHTGRLWLSVAVHQKTQDVRGCPCVSVSTHMMSVGVRQHTQDVCGCPCVSVCVHQHTQDVRGCPSVHISARCTHRTSVGVRQHTQDVCGCPWLSIRRHRTSVAVRVCLCVSVSTHRTSVAVRVCPYVSVSTQRTSAAFHQYTYQHVVHTGRLWVSASTQRTFVAVRECPSAHTGRSWLSISTHISKLILGLSMLALPVDGSGDFSPRGLSVQYTNNVCGCPSAHTGRPWLYVAVHQQTQDVCGCQCVSVSTHMTSVGVRQHTQDVRGCPWLSDSTHRTSVGVRPHTQDLCGTFVAGLVCPCVSVSTHRTSVAVHQYTYQHARPWTQHAGPSRGLFGTSMCVRQHTQDVCGCPWLSIKRHMTSVAVRVCPCVSVSTHRTSVADRVCPYVSVSTQRTSVAFHQYTYQHAVCLVHTGRLWVSASTQRTFVAVRECPSAHTGRSWLSISTHISKLILGLSMLALPVDCSGDFSPRGLSDQYTNNVCGCPSAHTGRPWLSVAVHQQTQDVCGCPCVSVSTHMTSVGVRQHTQDVRGCLWLSDSTHRTSVGVRQHTQDLCGCPSAHTGRPCVFVSTHRTFVAGLVCPCVSVSTHRTSVVVHQYTYQHAGPWTQHAGPSRGLFGTSMCVRQHTQDVCGCPWLSIRRHMTSVAVRVCPCVSVSTHRTSVADRVCPYVSVSTQRTSVSFHQYTYQHAVCLVHTERLWVSASTQRTFVAVRVCPSAHTGRSWLSISTHISTLILGLSMLALPVDCSGDFSPLGLSVQYTNNVCGCPSAHTGRPCMSISTHRTSVAVRVCPSAHTGRPWLSISTHIRMLVLGLSTLTLPVDCLDTGRLWLSVCARQHTHDVCGCPPAHTGRLWLSVCFCVCPSAHTGRLWLSISTHISTLVLGLSTLTLPVDCLGDFGLSGLSVQYTQNVRWCPPAHTGRLWLSVAVHQKTQDVCGCLCVSVSTHMMSVGVRQHTQDVCGCPCVSVCVHQHTQDVRGCPSVHISARCTHRTSVGVRQHTQDVCGCPWLSIRRHRTSVAVRVCPYVSVSTHRTSVAVRVCPYVSISTQRTSVAFHQYTYQHVVHTGRLWVSASTQRTFVAVRECPSAHTGRSWLSISTHISTLILGLSMLALPVDCSGDFSPRGLSVQYTNNVCGCPSAHTGRPWLSVAVHQQTQDVCGCPCVSVSTHMTSVGVRQHIQDVRGCPWVSDSTHRTSVGVRLHTQDLCGCPSAHTGQPCVFVSTHRTFVAGLVCPCVSVSTHRTSVAVHQYTYQHAGPWTQHADVRVCPSAHTGRPWLSVCVCVSISTHRTSVAVHQYTYQHVGPWTQHTDPSHGLFGRFWTKWAVCSVHTERPLVSASTHRTSVAVCGCPSADTGCPCVSVSTHRTSVAVRVCLYVSASTHKTFEAVHQYTYQQTGPWTQHAGPSRGFVRVILAHVGCLFSTHTTFVGVSQHTQDVCGCPCVSISTHKTSVAVHQYTYQDVGPWTQHANPSRGLFGTHRMFVTVRGCPAARTGRLWVSVSTHKTCVGVRQHTQDVRVCSSAHTGRSWQALCVRVCPSAHSGRLWLSISTHISTLVLGLSTLALPVDCSGKIGRRGLSVEYTQDVCGCPSAHTGRPCVSVSTHRTSVAVHQYTYQHVGPWTQHTDPSRGLFGRFWPKWAVCSVHTEHLLVSASTHRTSVAVCGCPSADTGRPWLSVWVRVCPSAHTGRPWLSVCVCMCPPARTGRSRLSISTHISTLVLGLSMLALPVDLFGTHKTSVAVHQYTYQDVGPWTQHANPSRGLFGHRTFVAVHVCRSAHTRRPWVSGSTHRTFVTVRGCPAAHTGRLWVSVSTHRTCVGVRKHTQDVRVCSSAHTGRSWLALCVRVCPSAHSGHLWLSISTHISTLVLGLSTLALPVDFSGEIGRCGLSVEYTQDVCGCPSAHTGRPWLSVCVRQHTQYVRGCPCVSVCVRQHAQDPTWAVCSVQTRRLPVTVSTHRMSVAVRVCPSAHTGRPWLSISTHISTLVLGPSTLTLSVDCLGDFGLSGLSVQYTQNVRWCPPAHIGRLRLSVAVHQQTHDVRGCPCGSVCVRQHTQDVRGCSCVSVCVRQHAQDVRGCPSVHISAHWSLDLACWPFPWICSGDFSPRGLSVQYTHDVCRCQSAHTGCLWLSVCVHQHTQDVRGCPSVQYKDVGPWTQHANPSRGLFGTHRTSVTVCGCPAAHTGRLWVSVSTHRTCVGVRQHTQDVRVCLSAHTGRSWLALCVRVCPSAHTGRLWLSISTHISTLVLGLSTLALPLDCSGEIGRRGLSVEYTQDVCGCPSPHTGCPCVSASTHRTSVAVRVCLCVSISTHRTSVAVHQYTYQHYTQNVRWCPPAHTGRLWLSVAVHQKTQDVCGCPCVSVSTHRTSVAVRVCPYVSVSTQRMSVAFHQYTYQHVVNTGRLWVSASTQRTFVAVRVCPSAHPGRSWLSISTYISTLILGLSMLALPVDCSGDFSPRGLSVQYTNNVCGCPSAHTGRPCVSVNTHRTSVAVRVCPSAHTGRLWLSISTHIRTLVLGLSTLTLPVDCLDTGRLWLYVCVRQHTQDVCGCPPAHTGCPWLSGSKHRTSVGVRQHTQDIGGCPSAHTGRPCVFISTHMTFVAGLVCPCVSVSTLRTSVAAHQTSVGVRQHTQDVRVCPSAHIRTSVAVHVCLCVSISTHRTSVAVHQHTQDVRGCPSVHISARCTHRTSVGVRQHTQDVCGCLWLSISRHRTSVAVRVGPCVSVSTDRSGNLKYETVEEWIVSEA
ncbi:hypothetical protein YC2023_108600 [Brassica napus]